MNNEFVCLSYLYLMYIIIMIFLQNSTGKITHKQYHFLYNILSRYVLFDGLFYDSFCFIDYCVTLSFMKLFVSLFIVLSFPLLHVRVLLWHTFPDDARGTFSYKLKKLRLWETRSVKKKIRPLFPRAHCTLHTAHSHASPRALGPNNIIQKMINNINLHRDLTPGAAGRS